MGRPQVEDVCAGQSLVIFVHVDGIFSRFISRPSSQDPDVISFLIAGRVDTDKLMSTPSAVIDEFYEITQRKDIVLGEVIWVSKYRLVRSIDHPFMALWVLVDSR